MDTMTGKFVKLRTDMAELQDSVRKRPGKTLGFSPQVRLVSLSCGNSVPLTRPDSLILTLEHIEDARLGKEYQVSIR